MVDVVKPAGKEDEFFLRQELEKRRKLAEEQQARMAEEARRALKELHWMHCPKCGHELQELDFREVKIDQCATCGGVWLDAGELDQLAAKEGSGVLSTFRGLFK